ncbi:MAG TPA: hypothetical protein VEF89_29620 [Solirubrobacteraceae bacterium]|nr:hypothetical protein [Solirubrobacteraceae bacterium]
MVFGRNMIDIGEIDRNAPRDSKAWISRMMGAAFPGSFLLFGKEQVIRCTDAFFRLLPAAESGRVGYIETIREWEVRPESWCPRRCGPSHGVPG